MRLPRRQFLHLTASAVALPFASGVGKAQAYPARPVRIIVGVSAGDSADILARLLASWLSLRLGQQFIIENRPGCWRQCWDRGRREVSTGRLYAPLGRSE